MGIELREDEEKYLLRGKDRGTGKKARRRKGSWGEKGTEYGD